MLISNIVSSKKVFLGTYILEQFIFKMFFREYEAKTTFIIFKSQDLHILFSLQKNILIPLFSGSRKQVKFDESQFYVN